MPSRGFSVFRASASPPGMEISTSTSARPAERRLSLLKRRLDHLTGNRVDGGLADGQRQAGAGHDADAGPRPEHDALPCRRGTHGRHDQRAVGHVRIVARVLDDAGARAVARAFMQRQREGRARAAGKPDLDRVRERAGDPARVGRLGGGGGAGSGGPAAAQLAGRSQVVHAGSYSRTAPGRQRRSIMPRSGSEDAGAMLRDRVVLGVGAASPRRRWMRPVEVSTPATACEQEACLTIQGAHPRGAERCGAPALAAGGRAPRRRARRRAGPEGRGVADAGSGRAASPAAASGCG